MGKSEGGQPTSPRQLCLELPIFSHQTMVFAIKVSEPQYSTQSLCIVQEGTKLGIEDLVVRDHP